MSNLDVAQITLEAWGAIFCAISALIVSFSVAKNKKSASVIQWLFLVDMNNLIADACAYIFRGKLSKFSIFMTRFCNFVAIITLYIMVLLAAHYIFLLIRENTGKSLKGLLFVVGGILIIPTIITIVNLFNGCMYYFDESNYYHRGHLYYGTMGIVLLAMYFCLVVVITQRKNIGMITAAAVCVYLLLPLVMMGVQMFWYGLSLVNLGTTVSLILVLLAYQKEQGAIYRRKQEVVSDSRAGLLLGQIKPDFVEDTLHSVEEYCVTDSLKARKIVGDLTGYLKDTYLFMEKGQLIPLSKELELVDYYINLEQARNHQVTLQKVMETEDFLVPPLCVEPLIENAIRYGFQRGQKAGHIMIKVFKTETENVIGIMDDGAGFDEAAIREKASVGMDLETVQERLKVMVNGTIEVESQPGEGTAVALHLPLGTGVSGDKSVPKGTKSVPN